MKTTETVVFLLGVRRVLYESNRPLSKSEIRAGLVYRGVPFTPSMMTNLAKPLRQNPAKFVRSGRGYGARWALTPTFRKHLDENAKGGASCPK